MVLRSRGYYRAEPVYVGQTNNLSARIDRHQIRPGYGAEWHTPWGDVPNVVGVSCKYRLSRRLGDWAMWELRLIHKLQPRFNKQYVSARWKKVRAA